MAIKIWGLDMIRFNLLSMSFLQYLVSSTTNVSKCYLYFILFQTLNYAGRLYFTLYTEGPTSQPPVEDSAPLAILVGNNLVIHYKPFDLKNNKEENLEVRFHENFWYEPGKTEPIDRNHFMIVLHTVQGLYIKAVPNGKSTFSRLSNISLQTAVEHDPYDQDLVDAPMAKGIEMCECPDRYTGLSCQVRESLLQYCHIG